MIYTYETLTQALQDWLEDDDEEFVEAIPQIIKLGEQRLTRDLDLAMFSIIEEVDILEDDEIITKPDIDAISYQSLGYRFDDRYHWLELRSDDFVRDYISGDPDLPRYYSELDEDTWRIAPISSEPLTLEVRCTIRPEGLGEDNDSTWLSTFVGDALLKACLAESERFLKSDDRIQIWEQDYAGLLPAIRQETYALLKSQFPRFNMTPMPQPQR
jgi:hypothetical protein